MTMSDLDTYVFDLTRWEGCVLFPYLDSMGLVSFGIGEHLAIADFCRVPWTIGDEFATPEQCGAAYAALLAVGQNDVFKFTADHYAQHTQLRLPLAVARQRCEDRLVGEFLPALDHDVEASRQAAQDPRFDDLNIDVRRVLVDLAWNLGTGEFSAGRWPRLFAAIAADDYREASRQCITVNKGETHEDAAKRPRNVWRVQMMLSCAGSANV
jgi:GH24 family phage-related lysozyme (muramidase)